MSKFHFISTKAWGYWSLDEQAERQSQSGGWAKSTEPPYWWASVSDDKEYGNVIGEEEHGYWINSCKKGNMSPKRAQFHVSPFNPLNKCDLCEVFGGPPKVRIRHDVAWWEMFERNKKERQEVELELKRRGGKHSRDMLCCGCWNKVRAIKRARREAQEIHDLKNQLLRGIEKWQKSRHQAS